MLSLPLSLSSIKDIDFIKINKKNPQLWNKAVPHGLSGGLYGNVGDWKDLSIFNFLNLFKNPITVMQRTASP